MNNYHIYEEIGRGKFSVVYKGRKKKAIEYMAVKSLEKSRRNKVLNEVKIFHSLNHPNIMRFYNWYETRNHLWVIFEYCSGGDLQMLIDQDKKLPEALVKSFSRDIVLALQYLHSKGVIYCDLKPANILLNEYEQLKISDFGLSRRIIDMITVDEGKESAKKGAPSYMAPELFQDDGVYSFQGDLWALGCVMHELATGKPPFVSKSFQDIVDQILNQEVQKVPGFSNEFNDLIDKLLQKNPAKRISWEKLISHPFWSGFHKFQTVDIPPQPHFDAWLATLNKQITALSSQVQQATLAASQNSQQKNVNMMRLSLNVQKNLKKELGDDYTQQGNQLKDIELNNRNQVINIGGRDDEDEEEHEFDQNIGQNIQNAEEDNRRNIDIDSQFHSSKQPLDTPIHDARNKHGAEQYNNNPSTLPGVSTNYVPVNELFTHTSDNNVKPIIGNKEIEKTTVDSFKKDQLPFQCYSAEEVQQGIDSPLIETHFENIFNSLIQAQTDKYNILCYFETITQNSQVANLLINSAFMNLLLKLIKTVKQTSTKIKLSSILGLLIRHATVIENELSQQGIPQILIETIKVEKSEKVKRRCMAALGEYLFYGATQMDEDPSNSVWRIPNFVLQFLVKILKTEGEDDLVKYYAAKTIENITAQSIETGQAFANPETCASIAQLYLTNQNEGLKTSAMVSLQHMTMLNNTLTDVVLSSFGKVQGIKDILQDGSSRVQQAFLTILNLQILISESELTTNLLNDLPFIETVVSMLDNQSLVVRGKALLTIFLIVKVNTKALLLLAQTRFFSTALEKVSRDSQTYVLQCFANVKLLLEEMTAVVMQVVLDEIPRVARGELANNSSAAAYYQSNQQYASVIPNLAGNLQYLHVLLQYANCSQLNHKLSEATNLESIFSLLGQIKDLPPDVKQVLFSLNEVLLSNAKSVQNNADYLLATIVPKVMDQLKAQLETPKSTDMRFSYLKLLVDITSPFLQVEGTTSAGQLTKIHEFLTKTFVNETLSKLLSASEAEQVQTMALKLLALLIENQPKSYVAAIKQNQLMATIIQQFTANPSRITLKVVAKITQCSTLQEINSNKIGQETVKLFAHFIGKQQEQCYEDLVDILLSITTKLIGASFLGIDKPATNDQKLEGYDYLLQAYETAFQLLSSIDFGLSEKVGMFAIHVIYLYGKFESKRVGKSDFIVSIIATINQYSMVTTMMRRNTRVLNWMTQLLETPRELKDKMIQVLDKVDKQKGLEDQKIFGTVQEIKMALTNRDVIK